MVPPPPTWLAQASQVDIRIMISLLSQTLGWSNGDEPCRLAREMVAIAPADQLPMQRVTHLLQRQLGDRAVVQVPVVRRARGDVPTDLVQRRREDATVGDDRQPLAIPAGDRAPQALAHARAQLGVALTARKARAVFAGTPGSEDAVVQRPVLVAGRLVFEPTDVDLTKLLEDGDG